MTDYVLAFFTAMKGQSLPPVKTTLNTEDNERQISLGELTINALGGKAELKALLDWR